MSVSLPYEKVTLELCMSEVLKVRVSLSILCLVTNAGVFAFIDSREIKNSK